MAEVLEVPRGLPEVKGPAPQAAAEVVELSSGSESSSSSSSSSSSRRRRKRRKQMAGAAAATALVTADEPLDLEEEEVERELVFPTGFAAPLQERGGVVAIMQETGARCTVQPREEEPNESVFLLTGTAHAVGRAASGLELAYEGYKEAEGAQTALGQVEIPREHLQAVVGSNEAGIAEVRKKCGGMMIAVMPAEEGPLTAYIGPAARSQVEVAERELRLRLQLAEAGKLGDWDALAAGGTAGSAGGASEPANGAPVEAADAVDAAAATGAGDAGVEPVAPVEAAGAADAAAATGAEDAGAAPVEAAADAAAGAATTGAGGGAAVQEAAAVAAKEVSDGEDSDDL